MSNSLGKGIGFLLGFLLLGLSQLTAQKNFATFIRSDFSDTQVEITYKVPAGRIYFVSLETNNENIIPQTANGLGEVSGSTYMSITWYFGDDGYERAQVEKLNFTIIALSVGRLPNAPKPPKENTPKPPKEARGGGNPGNGWKYAGFGGIGAGAGLGVLGFIQYGQATELYDVYQNNLDPEIVPYGVTSREQYFQDANDKYRQAQILMYSGGGLVLIGGALLILHRRNQGNASRVQLQPWKHIAQIPIQKSPALGLGMNVRF